MRIMINVVSIWALGLTIFGVGAAFILPEWGTFALIIAYILVAVGYRAYFHPALILGIGPMLMLLIGGLNISTYRGTIPPEHFGYILLCIMMLSGAAALSTLTTTQIPRAPHLVYSISRQLIIISLLPGIIGTVWILATAGIPILSPSARFGADAKALFLSETATVSAILLSYRYAIKRQFAPKDILLAGLIGLVLLIPGYRNWIIVAGLICTVGLVRLGVVRIRIIQTLLTIAAGVVFLGLVSEFRRMVSPELMSSHDSIVRYNIQFLPSFLAQIHFAFRESIALTSQLMASPPDFRDVNVFIADIMTMLPGHRASGGRVLAEAFGAVLAGGLTPGLIGLLTVEFGTIGCLLILSGIGAFCGVIWRLSVTSGRIELFFLYGFFIIHFIVLFHRGILKPSTIVIPVYFIVLIFIIYRLAERKRKIFSFPQSMARIT